MPRRKLPYKVRTYTKKEIDGFITLDKKESKNSKK